MARLEILGIEIDPVISVPVVILKVLGRGCLFPFWVGLFEANGIALELEGIVTPRPMTHDLLKNAIHTLGGNVNRVAITDLRENTYFATIYVQRNGEEFSLDARPSDAMSIALRSHAPIFIDDEVLERVETFSSVEAWAECQKRKTEPEGTG